MSTWGVIFDWDGVIIDSSRQHDRAWQMLAESEGRTLSPDYFKRSFGMKNERAILELLRWTQDPAEISRLSLKKEAMYRELIAAEGIAVLPGVKPLLAWLSKQGVPCVVGSSTPAANILCVLDTLGLRNAFPHLVCAGDVSHGKPHPEVFLKAAQRLGLPTTRCVVFEDAHVGIEAARAAGMKVVAVATTHPADTLSDADLVVNRLTDLDPERVAAWFPAA
ncbi:MAG: HAD family phosphatase [Verrucomicrobiota bacterium]